MLLFFHAVQVVKTVKNILKKQNPLNKLFKRKKYVFAHISSRQSVQEHSASWITDNDTIC